MRRSNIYEGMQEFPILSVEVSDDKEDVTFKFQGGPDIQFHVEGDCCSQSWIEHMDIPPSALGRKIIDIQEGAQVDRESDETDKCRQDYTSIYKTTFRTEGGDIVLEYRNSSNGYYGGWLERV